MAFWIPLIVGGLAVKGASAAYDSVWTPDGGGEVVGDARRMAKGNAPVMTAPLNRDGKIINSAAFAGVLDAAPVRQARDLLNDVTDTAATAAGVGKAVIATAAVVGGYLLLRGRK